MATVAGGWLGEYHYDDPREGKPVPFEATFSRLTAEGGFSGSILEEGSLGEATLYHARQVGDAIVFTKVYRARLPGLLPVRYEGRLLDEGRRLRGTWAIFAHRRTVLTATLTGWWEAHRTWNAVPLEGEEQVSDDHGETSAPS